MPRIARFTIESIAELTRQLRFAPPETRAKQMDAAEAFSAEIERDQLYPEDFVIFRITGYRPQRMNNPAILVGEALLADLAKFVQHISDGLQLPPDYRGRRALPLVEVAVRLSVASKTLQRYRKRGLICHYIQFSENDQRLACFEDSLARFVNGHETQIKRARDFSRVDGDTTRAIVEEARTLRAKSRTSLNEAALILARKHHRAHETVRLILRKHDRRSGEPIFTERGPLTERDGRVLHRAWRFGVPIALLAERYGRTATTIHRAINHRRAELLHDLGLRFIELPTLARSDAAEVILAVPAVCEGLDNLLPRHDALDLLEAAKEFAVDHESEVALLAAYNFLKRRAAGGIADLGEWPGAIELDAIETDLRWASRLKKRLICLAFATAIGRIEQNLHRPLKEQPTERIIAAVRIAVAIVSAVIETLDPSKGQRLTRMTAHAADRALARDADLVEAPGRAAVRHGGAIAIPDPFKAISPWDSFLEPRAELQRNVTRLDTSSRELIVKRHGWDGSPPRTINHLADKLNSAPSNVARRLNEVETQLLALHRSQNDRPAGR